MSTAGGVVGDTAADAPPVLELRGLSVRHGGVPALDRVGVTLEGGRITCVLGENGSGKSTLVAVLSGLRRPDGGDLLLDGIPVHFRSPRDAREAGVATVWQDLAVAPLLSVWRNLCLGAEPTRGRWPLRRLDVEAARATTVRAFDRIGVTGIDPDQPVNSLRPGARQSLAIARAVHFGARALVLDEPTEPMTIAQHTLVGQAVLGARARGLAVVLVTHNPRYAHLVGDRFLLLARGQVAGDLTRADVDADDLTRLMAGGEELTALTTRLQELHPELGER